LKRLITITLIVALSGFSQLLASKNKTLHLKSGSFELQSNIHAISKQDLTSAYFNGRYYVLLHFSEIPTNSMKLQLEDAGVKLSDYLPEYSFLAELNSETEISDLVILGVDGIHLIAPEFKMSDALAKKNFPEHAVKGAQVKIITQHHPVSSDVINNVYAQHGATVLSNYVYSNLHTLLIPKNQIDLLAAHPLIKFMEFVAPDAQPEDVQGQSNHRVNYISNSTTNAIPFNGAGVWLAVGDDGELGPHIDYAGRMDQTSVGASSGDHGDHVAGIMMGAGNVDPEARGMAWGANIKVYDVWDAVNSTPTSYFNPGVVVTSTSYGNGCNAGYTSFAQTADQQIRMMPNLMHVFSAGNSGTSDCGYGAGSGWGNITGGIKAGKNVLAVGNVTTSDNLSNSSSRGPASDGRIKPDICANGTQVYSCLPNNQYGDKTGTSMAAPGVSGAYGAIVQAYRVLNNGVTPSSDLVKGAMLNTADDLGNIGPDFKYGWGRLNARKVVQVFENNTYVLDSISQSGFNQHTITVPTGVSRVKIMVYWNDYEGATSSALALVNNIDMTVTDVNAVQYLPYVLDPSPNATSLNLLASNGVDDLNNMEQIVIDNPALGNLTVNINGTTIPQGVQKYSLVYEFITDEIIVTYPIGGEGFEPGDLEKIRWDAGTGSQSFVVEYTIDNGTSWINVSTVGSATRQVSFNVPNVVTGEAIVRVSRNGSSGQSLMPFSIIGVPQNIVVNTSCPNSFTLAWDSVPGATAYEVSILGAKYMDSVMTVTDTFAIVLGVSAATNQWVSVKAKTNVAMGRRAVAVEKMPGVWNCEIDEDIAIELANPNGTFLSDCIDYSSLNVQVKLINKGILTLSNIPLSMKFNQVSLIQETYFGAILPGDSATFTFSQTISILGVGSTNLLSIWKDNLDDNSLNDTVTTNLSVYSGTNASLPYMTNFQNQTTCSTASNCGATVCNLSGWINAENGLVDDMDFRVNVGGTPSSGTGPNFGHTTGGSIDKYVYLESSGGCEQLNAELYTPCFDLIQVLHPVAKIWYHMNGTEMGELHFDVFAFGKWNLNVLPKISGNQGSLWKESVIDLKPFVGQENVIVRYRAVSGTTFRSDIALDDFSMVDIGIGIVADTMPCLSAGATQISNTNISNASNYIWNFGPTATPASANIVGPHNVTYSSTGIKNITLSVTVNGNQQNYSQQINVVENPIASFTYNNPTSDGKVFFANTSSGFQSAFWEFDDGASSLVISPSHTYVSGGVYDVKLSVTNACGSESSIQGVNVGIVGMKGFSNNELDWNLYPNPSNGMVVIRVESGHNVQGLQLFDVNGQVVWRKDLQASDSSIEERLNLSFLAPGVYIVRLDSDNGSEIKRLIIQK
jgi:hypothetical protein